MVVHNSKRLSFLSPFGVAHQCTHYSLHIYTFIEIVKKKDVCYREMSGFV